jgi:hypothetical protein
MKITIEILGGFLVIAVLISATGKLTKLPDVMKAMSSVGVKEGFIPLLALLEIAGGLGIIGGIWNKALGELASVGLWIYFLGALASHLRKKHTIAEFAPALILLMVSTATAVLELKR